MSNDDKKAKAPEENENTELSPEDLDGVSGGVGLTVVEPEVAIEGDGSVKIKTNIKGGIGRVMKE